MQTRTRQVSYPKREPAASPKFKCVGSIEEVWKDASCKMRQVKIAFDEQLEALSAAAGVTISDLMAPLEIPEELKRDISGIREYRGALAIGALSNEFLDKEFQRFEGHLGLTEFYANIIHIEQYIPDIEHYDEAYPWARLFRWGLSAAFFMTEMILQKGHPNLSIRFVLAGNTTVDNIWTQSVSFHRIRDNERPRVPSYFDGPRRHDDDHGMISYRCELEVDASRA